MTTGGHAVWRHLEPGRCIVFGTGAIADAAADLPDAYTLLATPRALAAAPELALPATEIVDVPAGRVDEIAAALLPQVGAGHLVALGGGRVIDTAKAIAAAHGQTTVAAIPTTLSGAEMTSLHRQATGTPPDAPRVRPSVVVVEPDLATSQPPTDLAATAANALAHAVEALHTTRTDPLTSLAAAEAARLIATSTAPGRAEGPHRHDLALGALLAGWAVDHAGIGLHHVLAQTLVRVSGAPHGAVNAALLPATVPALVRRRPAATAALAWRLGAPPEQVALRLRDTALGGGLDTLPITAAHLDEAAGLAARRAGLRLTPPAADSRELREILDAAR